MLSPHRSLRLLVRRVPALAWRDTKMLEWRDKQHQASEAHREANEAHRQASGPHHRASEALKRSREALKRSRAEAKAARSEAARLHRQLTTGQRGSA